jgi:hypothetical protein
LKQLQHLIATAQLDESFFWSTPAEGKAKMTSEPPASHAAR